jgi:hypothetical protein
MKKALFRIFLFIPLIFIFSSCFELIEDTTFHEDGSGIYKVTLNMSSSQTRLNSVMAMDSIDGKKVPSEEELQLEIDSFVTALNEQNGIQNAKASLSTEEWILKFSCAFDDLSALKNGLNNATSKWQKKDQKIGDYFEVNFDSSGYMRKLNTQISDKWKSKATEDEDYNKLKEGKCVFIQRFPKPISTTSKENVNIAKNRLACMLMLSPHEIIQNPEKLNYSVTLID